MALMKTAIKPARFTPLPGGKPMNGFGIT